MSDTYDEDKPTQTLPPPPPWLEGNYEITVEPLASDYTVVAVHVQRACKKLTAMLSLHYTFGPRATVIMLSPPVVDFGGAAQCWVADAAALERAVKMAIRECEKGGTEA